MEQTGFQYLLLQRGIIIKILFVELQYLFSADRLIMVYISTTFGENIMNGFRVMGRTRFATDRQKTMGQTLCSPWRREAN